MIRPMRGYEEMYLGWLIMRLPAGWRRALTHWRARRFYL